MKQGILHFFGKSFEKCLAWLRQIWPSSSMQTLLANHFLNSLMESPIDGIIVINTDRKIILLNQMSQEILGRGRNEPLSNMWEMSENIYQQTENINIPKDELPITRALRGEVVHQAKIRIKNADDDSGIFISVSAAPLRNRQGKQIGAVVVFRNNTEAHRLSLQISQANKMEAIGRLAGGIAHDFNNKLGTILLTCDFIKGKSDMAQVQTLTNNIREVALKSADLTKQLLAYSRKQVIQPQVFDVKDRILSRLNFLKQLLHEDISIELNLCKNDSKIKVDPDQFDQILFNICANARDAMPQGGKLLIETDTLELQALSTRGGALLVAGEYFCISVKDSGLGMSDDTRDRIFEPFFTTKSNHESVGLGLAMVHGIVKQHGGEIAVYSKLGEGSTFKIYFPLAKDESEAFSAPKTQSSKSSGREKILVVEDDESLRGVTCEILAMTGYEVISTSNPSEVGELLDKHPDVSLLLTDVIMPQKNGQQVADEVSKLNPSIKVVFMSGYAHDVIEERGLLVSSKNFISKPVTAEYLLKIIREALDQDHPGAKSADKIKSNAA
jgi:two-component system cell cycle sensor histidine kinase/response regulator CckA